MFFPGALMPAWVLQCALVVLLQMLLLLL